MTMTFSYHWPVFSHVALVTAADYPTRPRPHNGHVTVR